MKIVRLFCLMFVLLLFINGCSYISRDNSRIKDEPKRSNSEERNANESISEFSIVIDNTAITIGEYEDTSILLKVLGKPISEEIEVLGPGSDTFMGSYIKKSKYNGFDITFMSPKGDGKKYWILDMKTNNPIYKTKRGIKTGDSINDLTRVYSNIDIVRDGRTDENNCAYNFNDKMDYIEFEVNNGKITEIRLYRELP